MVRAFFAYLFVPSSELRTNCPYWETRSRSLRPLPSHVRYSLSAPYNSSTPAFLSSCSPSRRHSTFFVSQVSLPSLSPLLLWKTGQALSSLRSQGILIVAGGLTIHSFENQLREFDETKAGEGVKEFERELVRVVQVRPVLLRIALKVDELTTGVG